jgi:signal transduction histidine kinase/ActR/RegA family two-component response regulator
VSFDTQVEHRERGLRDVRASYVPHRAAEEADGCVVLVEDVTESRDAERALRDANRRKDEFLATLAHELRNPLAPIRNAVHFMKIRGHADAALENARDIIDRQVRQMARLVDDLLDVSRISRGRIELQREPINLTIALENAVEACRPAIEQAGHSLALDLGDRDLYVDADLVRLSQVFANLLNNAAKYTPSGGRISLSAQRHDGRAVVTVADDGIGIPPEMLEQIFEMFVQVDSSLARSHGGLGIGLTLAKQLVQLHGGHIEARSEGTGRGSAFVVTLPLRAPASVAREAGPEAERRAGPRPLRILIADDNVDSAESLSVLLRSMRHETAVAYDGRQALEAYGTFRPDVAILDIGMPQLDGYSLARAIRAIDEGSACVLIALTGWGHAQDKQRALDAGFDEHLTKPVDPAVLLALIAAERAVRARSP